MRDKVIEALFASLLLMTRIGRRYLVVPLYEELAKTPGGLQFARGVYAKAKPGYHPMTQASIEKVLRRKH